MSLPMGTRWVPGLLFVLCCTAVARTPAAQDSLVAFTGATLIDGSGRPPIRDATLLVRGERILGVGPRSQVSIPAGAVQHDLSGRWVMPGMIDTHVHFWESARPSAQPTFVSDLRSVYPYEEEVNWMKQRIPFTLSRYICSGVTSVVSLGAIGWDYEVRSLADQLDIAPRVFLAAGPFNSAPVVGSYPVFGGEQTGYFVATEEEATNVLRQVLSRPAEMVKIIIAPTAEHPFAGFRPVMDRLIAEAHGRALPVSVHTFNLEVATEAVRAGADNLAHMVRNAPVDAAFIEVAVRQGTVVTTTAGLSVGYSRLGLATFELESAESSCGDPEVVAQWEHWTRLPAAQKPPLPGGFAAYPARTAQNVDNIRRLFGSGVPLAVGSDGGNIGTMHGPGFHRELRLLAEAGMPLMDVIVAATRNGAQVAGRERDLGTLEAGKLADFLVLEADPLADVSNLNAIASIFVRGRLIQRNALATRW